MAKNIVKLSLDSSEYITRPYGTCATAAATTAKVVDCADFSLATGATVLVKFTYANTASSPTLNVNSTGAKSIYYRGAALASSLYYWGAGDTVEFYYNGTQWDLLNVSNTNTTYSSLSASDATTGTATTGRLITAKVLHDKITEMLPSVPTISVTQTATSGNEVGKVTVNGTATTLYAPIQTTVSGNAGSATKLATARTIDGVSFNGSANITHYGTCSTAAATAAKTVALTGFTLDTGAKIAVKFTVTNTASSPTLNVNSTGAKSIMYRGSAISAGYLAANRVYEFVYDGTDYELIGDINTDSNTTYGGDRGISLVSGKFGHSNTAVTAKTAYGSTATTASANGGTIVVTDIKYDEYGHITGSTDRTITLSEAYKGTVTSVKITQGTGITVSSSGTAITGSGERTITLNTAATGTIGGIKIGKDNSSYAVTAATSSISADVTSGKYYAVEIDKDDKAFVYVPWTDNNTKNTAGSTNSSSKLFLIGATEQSANPTTYSHDTAYVGTDGHLYSNSKQVVNLSDTQALTNKTYEGYTLAAACAKAVTTSVTSGSGSLVTSGAVHTAIANSFAANDAMVFKGTLGTNGTITTLPSTTAKTGWTYRVITPGTYDNDKVCEAGDLIICLTDGSSSTAATWTVAQTNIDGAVTGPSSSTDKHVAIFSGSKGNVIIDSGFTIGKSVPSDAVFTDTTYTLSSFGITATSTELNYCDGVTSNIQTQLNAKSGTGHAHDDKYLKLTGGTLSGNLNFSGTNHIHWNNGTYQQRIFLTDDSSANTAVFTFQQSADTASTWKDLFTIKDDGTVVATTFSGSGSGLSSLNASNLSSGTVPAARLPLPTTSAKGGIVASNVLTTAVSLTSANGSTSGRYYGVQIDKDGKAFVNVPWVNDNTTYTAGTGLSLSNGKFSLAASGVTVNTDGTAKTYGNTAQQTPSHGGTFNIPYYTVDTYGRITAAGTTTVKLPSDNNTKNTAGSTNTSEKIFLIGATSQDTNPQTYSHDTAYVGTDGCLYSNSKKVSTTDHTHSYAGSSSAGGSATSAVKLDTATAGATNIPVYFTGGKPSACTSIAGVGILSKSVTKAITTSWADLLSATELNTLLTEGAGTYIVQVYGATSIGYSSGIMSWHTSGSTNDEILLHRTGASTNIYLRLSSRALQIAGSAAVASQSISIKFKKLI